MIDDWKKSIDDEIYNILQKTPTAQSAIELAALYNLQDRFRNTMPTDSLELSNDNPISSIIYMLSEDFQKYIDNSSVFLHNDISENKCLMLKNLENILSDIKNLISLITQSTSCPEEREMIEQFFCDHKDTPKHNRHRTQKTAI